MGSEVVNLLVIMSQDFLSEYEKLSDTLIEKKEKVFKVIKRNVTAMSRAGDQVVSSSSTNYPVTNNDWSNNKNEARDS